jgi:NAD(P)-dependent dehydrogenase (short-subunit alcohol dehydrogenase family)
MSGPLRRNPNSITSTTMSETLDRRAFITAGAVLAAAAAVPALADTKTAPTPATGPANKNGRFANKVVLITGATSGIGEATARAFAHEGARVVFNGRREELGRKVEADIIAQGGDATFIRCDIRDEKQVQAFFDAVLTKFGQIDIAFNNAGILNARFARLHETDTSEFMDVIHTNALGQFLCMKRQLTQMLKQGGGIIVNMCSVSGYKGFSEIGSYVVSNHARLGLTRAATLEYAKDNIRICSLAPGGVDTPMLRAARAARGIPFDEGSKFIPIQRTNTPEEMARAVMFLASPDASAFHGSNIDVTSGMLA